jgi:GrpB-like predicted nucleotidyltransferase (UPF0157 family)
MARARTRSSTSLPDLDEPIDLSDYDPTWPDLYAAEVRRIAKALPQGVWFEHIGSTSVPGMLAKPIIDIMIGVKAGSVERIRVKVGELVYEDMGEAGLSGRIYLRRRIANSKIAGFNAALVEYGGVIWKSNLALRDYLRANPDAAREYTEIKQAAVASGATSLLDYSAYKRECVNRLMDRAVALGK